SATLTGVAACNTGTGSATVTWTLVNDYNEVLNVTSSDNAAIPVGSTVVATGGSGTTQATFTQTIAAPAAGQSASATLSYKWTGDGYGYQDKTITSNKVPADCKVAPAPATAVLTTTPATCTSPATVTEGA